MHQPLLKITRAIYIECLKNVSMIGAIVITHLLGILQKCCFCKTFPFKDIGSKKLYWMSKQVWNTVLSVMPRRNQTKAGNGVVSVLSFDTMGQSLPMVHVPWHNKFGPEPAHGPDTAYPQFRPLKWAIFSTAAAPPF